MILPAAPKRINIGHTYKNKVPMNTQLILSWLLRVTITAIYLQTLYFKFTAHPDSTHIFSALGLEPYGRIGLGFVELITAVLVLVPTTRIIGLVISLGIISGAIFSHFLVLGIHVQGDGGGLFALAVIVFLATVAALWLHRTEVGALAQKTLNQWTAKPA